MTEYLRVKHWEDYQHYKRRKPPWIKLYTRLLADEDFLRLTEDQQWQLVRIWLLAAKCGNRIAWDEPWIRRAIGSLKKVPLDLFVASGWLLKSTPNASTVLAPEPEKPPPDASNGASTLASVRANGREEISEVLEKPNPKPHLATPAAARRGEFERLDPHAQLPVKP